MAASPQDRGVAPTGCCRSWLGTAVSWWPPSAAIPGELEFFADATDDSSQAIEWTMPAHRFVDAAPLLVLTTSSLRTGAGLHPGGAWDPRRFRPNLLIDHEGQGWVEDLWIGRHLRVGTATLVPTQECIRCTMVTRSQPGLELDVDVFRTLARHHVGRVGVWSEVLMAGKCLPRGCRLTCGHRLDRVTDSRQLSSRSLRQRR